MERLRSRAAKVFVLALGAMSRSAWLLGATLATAAAASPAADPRLAEAIRKANSEFEVAMTKADAAAIVAPYTADAVFVAADGTVTKGRDRIEQLYRDRFARSGPALETRIQSEELMVDGDVAYERGKGSITLSVKGERVTNSARFLTVWQRQPDGDWKISRNLVLAPGPPR